jgi:hypothetical protein
MSMTSKILAGAATVVIAGGAGAAGLLPGVANAATPSCGHSCINLFNEQIGHNFVLDSKGQGQSTGTEAILYQASNSDPAEDWTILGLNGPQHHHKSWKQAEVKEDDGTQADTVTDYYEAGLVSSFLNLHYGHDIAFEIEYTPYGAGSDECLGIAAAHPGSGTKVSLQPCGETAQTLWVVDKANVAHYDWQSYVPLINGADLNYDNPYVLTYPNGYPTDQPRPQLETEPLVTGSRGGVSDTQEWGVQFGVLR